ncbi:MAG: GNAT family protein [Maricaulaceae bacterium]
MKADLHTELTVNSRGGALTLRHPRWADYEAWSNLRENSREHLSPWEPSWNPDHLLRRNYKHRLSVLKKQVTNGEGAFFHIFRSPGEHLIGAVNVMRIQRSAAQSAQLGYWLGKGFSGQGHGRAAIGRVCEYCYNDLGLHRLEAAVRSENNRSISLLKALNFHEEGVARGYLKIDGQWHDHIIYARLSSDG